MTIIQCSRSFSRHSHQFAIYKRNTGTKLKGNISAGYEGDRDLNHTKQWWGNFKIELIY